LLVLYKISGYCKDNIDCVKQWLAKDYISLEDEEEYKRIEMKKIDAALERIKNSKIDKCECLKESLLAKNNDKIKFQSYSNKNEGKNE